VGGIYTFGALKEFEPDCNEWYRYQGHGCWRWTFLAMLMSPIGAQCEPCPYFTRWR